MPERHSSESSDASSDASSTKGDETPASDLVVTKFGVAGEIANSVLKKVLEECKDGVEIGTLCDLGDRLLTEATSKVFKKEKEVTKGIAMPTCISVDNVICHFSPLRSDPPVTLKNGQLVKVDLGCHIDGFIATAAHTIVVGATPENKVTGRKADVIRAAYDAQEAAIRMLRAGKFANMEITGTIDNIASEYGVKAVENFLSHQLLRNKIDGEKTIIQNPGEKHRQEMEKCKFEKHEVYAIDILFTTGEGKAKDRDTRTTVYKHSDEIVYQLKMKHSRTFFSDAVKKHGTMAFTLRSFEDEVKTKLGVGECEKHLLLKPYPVLYEKDGEVVAQFKSTVIIMPNGLLKIAGIPLDATTLETDKSIKDATIVNLLAESLKPKAKKNKKKPAAESADAKTTNAKPAAPAAAAAKPPAEKKPTAAAKK